jgi:PAS domain S-box-containing protein
MSEPAALRKRRLRQTKAQLVEELELSQQHMVDLEQMVDGRENEVFPSEHLGDQIRIYRDAPIGLCVLDTDFRYLQINDWLAAINGFSVEDHLGRTIGEVLPAVSAGVEAQFRHVIETGQPVINGIVEAETPAQPGITKTFEHCYLPIRSDDGMVVGISCVVQDVTERKQSERALQEAHDELEVRVDARTKDLREVNLRLEREISERMRAAVRFEALLESAPDPTISVDRNGKIVEVNEQAARSFGYSRHELIDQGLEILVPDELRGQHIRHRREYSRNPTFRNMGTGLELTVLCKDGRKLPVEISLSPADISGSTFVIAAIRDITQRKEVEDALRKSRDELQSMSARLIHAQEEERSRIARELHDDFNQRLALMILDIEQLARDPADSQKTFDQRIHGLLGRIKELSSDVHRLSHQLHPTTLVHLGLVKAVKSLCRELSDLHGRQIEFVDREVPKSVPNDVALCLYRIVQETLRNAIKHSGARKARVELTRTREGLVLRVRDWGAGFDVAAVKGKGGLGLISMGERLRLVGGQIAIESSEARGTQIEALVPLPRTDAGDGNR